MRFRAVYLGLVAGLVLAGWLSVAQEVAAQPPDGVNLQSPAERFRFIRELISEGKYDLAAEQLKALVAGNPTEQDYLGIQTLYGVTAFERLRLVPVWSDNPAAQAEAVKAVDTLIAGAREASKKVYRDPQMIARYVRNLGETREERLYAEDQLRKGGDAVVQPMIQALQTAGETELASGILGAIRRLGLETVPGFLAAAEGLPDERKADLLYALVNRPDVMTMISYAETNPLPWLWYYSSAPVGEMPLVRRISLQLLQQLTGQAKTTAGVELLNSAQPFIAGTARFTDFDQVPDKVRVWTWNPELRNVQPKDVTRSVAEEHFGLRNLRWALQRDPGLEPAREAFLALAAERAVIRYRFGVLSQTDPVVYQLLAATPTDVLIRMLDAAMLDRRSALAFALTQGLADRGDRASSVPSKIPLPDGKVIVKAPVLSRALDYPDPRVQLAAAIGLLRAPGKPLHERQARIVEILARALNGETPPPGARDQGRAVIGDPNDTRAAKLESYLRELGYSTERTMTGRDLLQRVRSAADVDLIILDRHLAYPELRDVVAQLSNNAHRGGRSVLIVASTDQSRPVPLEHLLLRLAVLIAVTETEDFSVTPPFAFDPRKPPILDLDQERTEIRRTRDQQLQELARLRLARLQRLVESVSFPISFNLQKRLDLRLPQLTYAVLAVEYPVTMESAPNTYQELQRLTDLIRKQSEFTESTERVPTESLGRMIEQLNNALDPARRARLDLYRRKLNPETLILPSDTSRDLILEDRLRKQLPNQGGFTIIPEPYSLVGFREDLDTMIADPAQAPRTPEEKRLAARYALEWLHKIASGEISGYDARPAESAIRQALLDPELAPLAVDTLRYLPSAPVQQDLLNVALAQAQPELLRLKAADRTILHIQQFGKLIPANQIERVLPVATAEAAGDLKGKLLVIHGLLAGSGNDIVPLIQAFPSPVRDNPEPAKPMPAP